MRKVRVNLLPLITAIVSQNERSKEIESALGCLVSFNFSLFELTYNDITTIYFKKWYYSNIFGSDMKS